MAPNQAVFLVEVAVPGGGLVRLKVGFEVGSGRGRISRAAGRQVGRQVGRQAGRQQQFVQDVRAASVGFEFLN